MNVLIVTPAPPGSLTGNRVTAERWAGILRALGHRVAIEVSGAAGGVAAGPDLLVALHAAKSAGEVEEYRRRHPGRPVVVALTGTDLYGDIRTDAAARAVLEVARRLVTLHPTAAAELPTDLRSRTRAIVQSSVPPADPLPPLDDCFEVCVSGHLRPVKDPFLTAAASRRLPPSSRLRITHLGAALEAEMADRARAEMASNPRYLWLGGVPRDEALRLLDRARLLVLTSTMEGGANVVCEALASEVPVISTRIEGSIGLLGDDYPGYFPVGDAAALAELLGRVEAEPAFYAELVERCRRRRHLVEPARERQAWGKLLRELPC